MCINYGVALAIVHNYIEGTTSGILMLWITSVVVMMYTIDNELPPFMPAADHDEPYAPRVPEVRPHGGMSGPCLGAVFVLVCGTVVGIIGLLVGIAGYWRGMLIGVLLGGVLGGLLGLLLFYVLCVKGYGARIRFYCTCCGGGGGGDGGDGVYRPVN